MTSTEKLAIENSLTGRFSNEESFNQALEEITQIIKNLEFGVDEDKVSWVSHKSFVSNKYSPHQGRQEKDRRVRKMEKENNEN